MGQRNASALPAKPEGGTWDTFIQCEVEHDEHEVHPTTWPPPRTGNIAGDPSMNLVCVRCGTNCPTYVGHATGKIKGIKVVLPS